MRDERGASPSGYRRSPLLNFSDHLSACSTAGPRLSPFPGSWEALVYPRPVFVAGGPTRGTMCAPPPLHSDRHAAPEKGNPALLCPRALSTPRDASLARRPPSWVMADPLDRRRAAS
ncbi:hypothetical protein NDU88_005172 [Pleurodeles waltl]|uniref:Uncharacterized protein n=1 Tax=Pleurodeles waltl TaxID=8319 RepID=A0AAV7UJ34_PLEWA|nr:hypothetical protein NDU88_005172 [Pleurodeles waltl]